MKMARNTSEMIHFIILRSVGNFIFLFGLFGVLATFGPAVFEEARFQIDKIRGVTYIVAAQNEVNTDQFAHALALSNEKVLTPPDPFFSVVIPKIGASSRVIPNVDSTNQTEYVAALQKGIAHASGSVFPGLTGTTFFFAHSTDSLWNVGRYNAVFYLLKDLTVGDQIIVFFKDKRFNYTVTDTKIIDPSEVSLLTQAQKTSEQLVLQTCWPPGTTWKRFVVTAKPDASLQ